MASILIIDDDVTLLSGLSDQLEQAGFSVVKSSDLRHGEQLYAQQRPDAVLLEVRSDNDAGWELLPRLAAETTVLVLSAASREEDVVRGFELGAADYLAKPYRSGELLARLRSRLAQTHQPSLAAPQPLLVDPPVLPPQQAAVGTTKPLGGRRASRREPPADESVFMSEAEEMALLRSPQSSPAATVMSTANDPDPQQGLGLQMRVERQRRHLTLVQIENDLKIRMSYLQAMEDEKFTLLPRGPAALQMVHTYATFLGLDVGQVDEEFRRQHYAEPNQPLPALGGSRLAPSLPRWAIVLLAVLLALAVSAGVIGAFDPGFFARLPSFFAELWAQILGLFQRP